MASLAVLEEGRRASVAARGTWAEARDEAALAANVYGQAVYAMESFLSDAGIWGRFQMLWPAMQPWKGVLYFSFFSSHLERAARLLLRLVLAATFGALLRQAIFGAFARSATHQLCRVRGGDDTLALPVSLLCHAMGILCCAPLSMAPLATKPRCAWLRWALLVLGNLASLLIIVLFLANSSDADGVWWLICLIGILTQEFLLLPLLTAFGLATLATVLLRRHSDLAESLRDCSAQALAPFLEREKSKVIVEDAVTPLKRARVQASGVLAGMEGMQSLEIGRGKRKVHFAAPGERKATWGNPHLKRNPGPGTYEHEPVKVDLPLRLPGGTGGGGPPMEPPGFGSDVPHCSTTFASSKVPTAFFPKSFSPAMLPGPATYFAEPAPKSSPDRPLPAFRSVSARFADRESAASPGPGHYPSLSDFPDDRIRRARSVPDFMNRKFFGVQNPYQLKSLRETDGASLAGFGSRSPQRPVTVSKSSAAPGSYDPESSIGQSISAKLRQLAKIAQGGAFGGSKTGERFFQGPGTSGDNAISMSAPSLPQADPVKDAGDAARGSFKSEAPRLPAPTNEELPGPGAYDPITNPDFRTGWRIAKTDHVGFGGSGARFASGETDVPPPGSYEMAHENIRGGYHPFRSTEARGLPMPKVAPKGLDPGCYDVARSLIRKTFNTKVEEHALLLQTPSDKRPPPRGPFPWAEGSSWKPKQALERAALEDAPSQAG
ncbi:unnamed protein product [Symbiodinium sp. CCMP2456]|nr:unnamed protein product [Symbiodinium sp. CCMP2456]